jgi:hypothetical protein
MKIVVMLLALLPVVGFANDQKPKSNPLSIFNKECKNSKNPTQNKKNCLDEEKAKEAENNFKNFQENKHMNATF